MSAVVPDGTYDVFVVDADEDPSVEAPDRIRLSVTIVAGDHRGEVVDISASGLARSSIDLLGMPATLTVDGGAPTLRVDDA